MNTLHIFKGRVICSVSPQKPPVANIKFLEKWEKETKLILGIISDWVMPMTFCHDAAGAQILMLVLHRTCRSRKLHVRDVGQANP
jgi:hypothetical protein